MGTGINNVNAKKHVSTKHLLPVCLDYVEGNSASLL